MGNCQAAEAATLVIQHPGGGRVERLYWSLTASQVMAANPGHYVAVIISPPNTNINSQNHSMSSSCVSERAVATASPVKHLKLLRPDDTLHIGQVYRLVSFEEVLKEFASKKHVKLSRLVLAHNRDRERGRGSKRRSGCSGNRAVEPESSSAAVTGAEAEAEVQWIGSGGAAAGGGGGGGISGVAARQAQWRPALQSIEEAGGT